VLGQAPLVELRRLQILLLRAFALSLVVVDGDSFSLFFKTSDSSLHETTQHHRSHKGTRYATPPATGSLRMIPFLLIEQNLRGAP
jgi:hypothetical protein